MLFRTFWTLALLFATLSSRSDTLTWINPNPGGVVEFFRVYRSVDDLWQEVDTTPNTYYSLGAFPLGASTVTVTAVNKAGESDKAVPITFSIPSVITPPAGITNTPLDRAAFDRWYAENHIPDAQEKAFRAAVWGRSWTPPPPPVTAPLLAILVADNVVNLPGFVEWYQALQVEFKWRLVRSEWPAMVGWNDSRRLEQIKLQMEWVEAQAPDCVITVGNLARLAAGFESMDGHDRRCEWSFLHLSGHANFDEFTDKVDYGVSGGSWLSNRIGDGRFDHVNPAARVRKRPVFSIDAAFPHVNATHVSGGFQIWPPRTELQVLQTYFERNLAYRRGQLTLPKEVYMHGSGTLLWTPYYRDRIQEAALNRGFNFIYDERGSNRFGRLTRFVYSGSEPYLWHLDGPEARAVVHVLWKSYGGTRLQPGASVHYALERAALVSVWGYDWVPHGPTAFDFFKKNRGHLKVFFSDSIYGDPTLSVE